MNKDLTIVRHPNDLTDLAKDGAVVAASNSDFRPTVRLDVSRGWFVLAWNTNGATPGKWDCVALYKDDKEPDGNYLTNQWQWANGNKTGEYTTGTAVDNGLQARYLIWNGSAYISIARTPPFNGNQASR